MVVVVVVVIVVVVVVDVVVVSGGVNALQVPNRATKNAIRKVVFTILAGPW